MPARFYTSYEVYPAAAGIFNLARPSPLAQRAHQRHHVRYQHGATLIAES